MEFGDSKVQVIVAEICFGDGAISHVTNINDINDGIPRFSWALSNKSRSSRSKQVAIAKVIIPAFQILLSFESFGTSVRRCERRQLKDTTQNPFMLITDET